MKKIVLIASVFFFAFQLTAQVKKIMPTGDSFCERNDPGYRGYLWNLLIDNGFTNFTFVGPRSATPPNIYAGGSAAHAGFSGATIGPDKSQWGNLYSNIPTAMNSNPDIILLQIGVNDLFNRVAGDGVDIPTMKNRLSALIDYIYTFKSSVTILVANLCPLQFAINGGYYNFDVYNAAIPGIVQAKVNAGKKCIFVNMNVEAGFTLADFQSDNTHPNASGYQKMAKVYYNYLSKVLNEGLTSVPVTGVSVSPATANIYAGSTQQLSATFSPSNATNKSVSWSSDNTAVATVSSSGLVTGVASGSAIITVTTVDGGKTATSTITVTTISNGVSENTINEAIIIYPNPLTGRLLHITTNGIEGTKNLNIYDISGRKVYSQQLINGKNNYVVDLSSANLSGIYFVKIVTNEGKLISKLIIR